MHGMLNVMNLLSISLIELSLKCVNKQVGMHEHDCIYMSVIHMVNIVTIWQMQDWITFQVIKY